MNLKGLGCGEDKLETIISYWLLTGVVVSLALTVTGLVFYLRLYGNFDLLTTDNTFLVHGQNFFTFLAKAVDPARSASDAVYFFTLGLAMLILTPFVMIIVSFVYFAWRRNWRYVLVTGVVTAIITFSLIFH